MKKLLFLLFLILFNFTSILAYSEDEEDPWSEDNFEESFNNDPVTAFNKYPDDAWNHMTPEMMNDRPTMLSAFNNNPDKAYSMVESNPNLMSDPNVIDRAFSENLDRGFKIIGNNPDLMSDPTVISKFEAQLENPGNIGTLNNNPNVKKEWFSSKGIDDQGANVESFSGGVVKTSGENGCSFNIEQHPGAKLLEDGSLVLNDGNDDSGGTRILGSDIVIDDSGQTTISGGEVDITNSNNVNFIVNDDGTIKAGDTIYSSNSDLTISEDDEGYTIKGEEVIRTQDSQTLETFSGEITYFNNGDIEAGKNSEFTQYDSGKKLIGYGTENKLLLSSSCNSRTNCIENNEGIVNVNVEDNKLGIKLYDTEGKINHIDVNEILDDSEVILRRPGKSGTVVFSKDPIKTKGFLSNLGVSFTTTYEGERYDFNYVKDELGKETITTEQFMTNIEYLMAQGYDIHDISLAAHLNYYDSFDYAFSGALSKFVTTISPEGEEGQKYDDPALVNQIETMFPDNSPWIVNGDDKIKITHTFAAISGTANTNFIVGHIRTWINTYAGDTAQVVVETGGNFIGGNFEIASQFHSPSEQKANELGVLMGGTLLDGGCDNSCVVSTFDGYFKGGEDISQEEIYANIGDPYDLHLEEPVSDEGPTCIDTTC